MTSMSSESATTILCTSKQTRFHISTANYRELDVDGVNITITAAPAAGADDKPPPKSSRVKAKGKSEGVEILSNAKLSLKEGRRYALIGRNGTGKSTLLKSIAEKLIPGIPEESKIAILQQTRLIDSSDEPSPTDGKQARPTVLQTVVDRATSRGEVSKEINILSDGVDASDPFTTVRSLRRLKHERLQKKLFLLDKDARLRSGARGIQARKALVAFEKVVEDSKNELNQTSEDIKPDALKEEIQEAVDMLADLQLQIEPARLAEIESRAKTILTGLGYSDAYMEKPITSLSGGWHMRAALATCLLQDADILILDEPTNFLDLLGIIWLQRYLESLEESAAAPTLILVSHDRDFVSLCTDLIILKDKQLEYFHGDLPTYEESQSERRLWLTKMKDAQDKQRAHVEKSIAANKAAGKANDDQNKLRQAKSRQKKLDDRWGLQVSAKGGRFKLNRDLVGYHLTARDEIDVPPEKRPVVIALPEPLELRFPGSLISLEGVSYRYSRSSPFVVQDVNLTVGMGDRIGILGLNGSGKSTLIQLIADRARPTTGTVTVHPRLRMGYYTQHAVEALQAMGREEPTLTPLSLLMREAEGALEEGEIRGLLGHLGLPGRTASDVPLTKLSGGQLVRCELARLFWRRPHCLVLDEVTTHLDYETVTALREAIDDWEGAVVLVTHDRWFMRGAVEHQGTMDDDAGDAGSEDGEESARRRLVYRLKGGKLAVMNDGVDQFERLMDKRAAKLMGD